jgi:hydroxyacylglutathione hydrolase
MGTFSTFVLGSVASIALVGCVATSSVVGKTSKGQDIVQIHLSLSNAYLIKSHPPVLIDSGSETDLLDLDDELAKYGVKRTELGLVIITHAHADHASLARVLQSTTDAKIMLGAGDVAQAHSGHNDELKPYNFTAGFLKLVLPMEFEPFNPDVVVTDAVDLKSWGVEGQAMQMPGHTEGSVVVVLPNHAAFVGDEILGGTMGGAFFPHDPGEHYFHADSAKNHENIKKLVDMGIETFYLGHGGPVKRADVIAAFHLDAPK